MSRLARLMLLAIAGSSVLVTLARGQAQDNAKSAPETPPVKSSQPADKDKEQADLKQVLERLNKVEKELLELRIKSGKVPADKADQRVITLLETPYLGSAYYGSPTSMRFLAVKLMLVNLTDAPLTLKREDIQLAADGQVFAIKEAPQNFQYQQFQIGPQAMQLRNLQTPKEIALPVGGTASTWMLFPEIPPGNHVPQMAVKLKLGEHAKEVDVNATQRDVLGLKVERLGPKGSLGLLTIAGSLNTINVGSLVEELDRLAGEKVVRAVIRWEESASFAEPQVGQWIQQATTNLGRQQQPFEGQFPGLPASLRELHLAQLPGPAAPVNQYMGIQYGPGMASVPQRIHKTDAEAVAAALQTAYEALPRDELLQSIQNGTRLERIAALAGGGGRLASDKLPLILKFADDNDPAVQQAALSALSHFGEPEAIEKLVFNAKKNTPPVSSAALAGLAGSRFAAANDALLSLLANEPPESKKNIVKILAAYPRPAWSDVIYEFVRDPRSGLNVEALNALVQVGHPKLVSVLAEALASSDDALRQQALSVLVNRTDRESEEIALAHTLEQIKNAEPNPVMLQLLNRVKDKRAIPLIKARFKDSQNKVALIQTLALIGDQETSAFLAEKYPNLQSHEKGEVLRALSRLDVPRFRQLAAQALLTADSTMVNYAVQGLQEDGGPEAIKIMIDALDSAGNSFTWSYLCNSLSNVATPAARAALIKARDSGNAEKRNFALGALQNMRYRSPGFQNYRQGQELVKAEKWQEAFDQYTLAIEADPSLSDAYADRAHTLLHLNKLAEAGKDFSKAWELDPYNSAALTGQCLVMVMVDGKYVEALKKLEESRQRFLGNAMFHYNAACVYGRAYEHVQKDEKIPDRDKLLTLYRDAAMADLKKAVETGFRDFELMKKDDDLKPFRELPQFEELLATPAETPAANAVRGGLRKAAGGVMRARMRKN